MLVNGISLAYDGGNGLSSKMEIVLVEGDMLIDRNARSLT
jgi:hypothetical protein